jgi:hypothetical protein
MIVRVAVFAALALAVGDAPAQEAPSRFYAGAGLAATDFDGVYSGLGYGASPLDLHLYGGFEMQPWLALELALDRLGDIRHEGRGSGLEQLRISAEHSSLSLQGTFSLSLQEVLRKRRPITVFATVGIASFDTELAVLELTTSRQATATDESTGAVLATGVRFDLARVRLRAYLRSIDEGGSSLRSLGAAAEFRF